MQVTVSTTEGTCREVDFAALFRALRAAGQRDNEVVTTTVDVLTFDSDPDSIVLVLPGGNSYTITQTGA